MVGTSFKLATKRCAACGETFQCPAQLADSYSACSPPCTSALRRKALAEKRCDECGHLFTPKGKGHHARDAKFCGNPCRITALQRIPRPLKGKGDGWFDDEGHVVLAVWDGEERRIVKRSRLVIEQQLRRRLTPTEVVHHVNLSPADDRPENLFLCRDQAEHMRIHAFTAHLMKTGLLNLCGDTSEDDVG